MGGGGGHVDTMTTRHFIAAKALLRHNGKILILRESGDYIDGIHQGRYDLCGGRIDPKESLLAALAREVQEEAGLRFDEDSAQLFFTNAVTVQKHGETWHITRHFFVCDALDDNVQLGSDHDAAAWITPAQVNDFAIIPNLLPVFAAYADWIKV